MKCLAAFALVVLSCVPAMAQLGGGPGSSGRPQKKQSLDAEFLEMEQEADKAALKEALLHQARLGMKPAPVGESEQKGYAAETATLREFIAQKKDAIKARAAELTKGRVAEAVAAAESNAGQPPQFDWKAAIEKTEDAQVEVQLLQAKLGLLEAPLAKAIQELAAADLAASTDEKRRDKAVAARKEYEKLKAKHVELSKQLRLEQQQAGVPMGMGGGMGGMGGGFR